MTPTSNLAIFSGYVEQSEPELPANLLISNFLAAFFDGDTSIFTQTAVDGTREEDLELFIWWPSPPLQGMPTYQSYGQNRWSLFYRILSNSSLSQDMDLARKSVCPSPECFARFSAHLRCTPASQPLLTFANTISVRNLTMVRFLAAHGVQPPVSWLKSMGIADDQWGKAGRKPGTVSQARETCEALDTLIASGIYSAVPRGASAAARLIKQILGSPLTEKGITAHIQNHHDEILRSG